MKKRLSLIASCWLLMALHSFAVAVDADEAALAPQLWLRLGHAGSITTLAYSPDGAVLASGALDNDIRLWDARSGDLLRVLHGHRADVSKVIFSADGAQLASGGRDERICLWDVATGNVVRTIATPGVTATALAFSPDGRYLATGANHAHAAVWDLTTGELRERLRDADARANGAASVRDLRFGPDDTLVIANEYGIQRWSLRQPARKLSGTPWQPRPANGFAEARGTAIFSSDGGLVATFKRPGVIDIYETATLRAKRSFKASSGTVVPLAFAPSGKLLAMGSQDGVINIGNVADGPVTRRANVGYFTGALAFAPDGENFAVGSADFNIHQFGVNAQQADKSFPGSAVEIAGCALDSNGALMATTHSGDGTVRLWDIRAGSLVRTIDLDIYVGGEIAFSPNDKLLAWTGVTNDEKSEVYIWNVAQGRRVATLRDNGGGISGFAFAPDGRGMVTGNLNGTLKLWDVPTGKMLAVLKGPAGLKGPAEGAFGVAYAPNGKLVAGGYGDGYIRIWDVGSRKLLQSINLGAHSEVTAVYFSPKSKSIMAIAAFPQVGDTVSRAGDWNVDTGRMDAWFEYASTTITQLGYINGHVAAVSANDVDDTYRLVDCTTGQAYLTWHGVRHVTWNRSGKIVAAIDAAQGITLYRTDNGAALATFMLLPAADDKASTDWIAYTPEGHYSGSPQCTRLVRWRVGDRIEPAEVYANQLNRPDLVRTALEKR